MFFTAIARGCLRLAIVVLPTIAGAQSHCPDRSDLAASGVVLVQTGPYYMQAFRLETGELHGRFFIPNAPEPSGTTIFAHPLTMRDYRPDGLEATTVGGLPEPSLLDRLPEIGRIEAELEYGVRGGTPFSRPIEWAFRGWDTHTTDEGCRYETWVVDSRFRDEETGVTIRRFLSPDLGLVLRIDHIDAGGKPIINLFYNSVTVAR